MRIFLLILGLLCCLSGIGQAADIQITAEINPAAFSVDTEATLVIKVNGSSFAQPELPVTEGLRFRALGQSQQTSWINGQVSATVTFNFAVQAEKPGQYTIKPVKLQVDGQEYTTPAVRCTVSPVQGNSTGGVAPPPSTKANAALLAAEDLGWLRIQLDKDSFYAGQLISFTIKGYFKPNKRIHIKTVPRLLGENFLLHALDKEPSQQQEHVEGELLTVLTWRGKLSAVKEGIASIAVDIDADLMVPEQKRRSDSPFDSAFMDDPFFEDFFGGYTRREIRFASPKTPVTALPLPAKNRPVDFKGAVGTFSLAVAASPTNGRPGEPITLKMKVTGSGNFDRVQPPELTDRSGWKVYPPADSFADQGGKGEKTFEQAVVPINRSLQAVPSLRFSYFDPVAGDYVSLSSEPIPLHLQEAMEPVPQPVQPQQPAQQPTNPKAPGKQPHPLRPPSETAPGQSVQIFRPLYEQQRFQAIIAGAGCCLVAGLLLDLRRKRLENNPGPALRRQAERQLARDCQAMQAAMATGAQEEFQQHCQEAIQHWTGTLWRRTAATITLTDLQERLPADSPLLPVFARLEESSYAGAVLTQAEMAAMLQTVQQELGKLS